VASPLLRPAAPAPEAAPAASVLRPKPIEPEVITTAGPVAKPAPSPGGIYMPPLQGLDAKIQEAAVRLGTTDLATIANDLKIPTTRIEGNLEGLMRQFRFRDAVAKASPTPSQKLAEAAPDMPADMGSVIRRAKETARSPIDNVSGRNIKQVSAVKQQETWRATYDNLKTPEARLAFMRQIKQETGLPDDTIRRRLKLSKVEWKARAFDRGGSLSARPDSVLRRKAPIEEPNVSGGEGESEALTDMENEGLLERALDTVKLHAPWAVDRVRSLAPAELERLAQIGAGNLPKTVVPGGLSPRSWTELTLKKGGVVAEQAPAAAAPVAPAKPKPKPKGKIMYHTTSAADLDDIAHEGLVPQARPSKFGGSYESNSAGRTFLAGDKEAARNWAAKVEDALFGSSDEAARQAPVALRVRVGGKTSIDNVGSRDVPNSFYTEESIQPDAIEFFDGTSWRPLSEWAGSDAIGEASTFVPSGVFPD
jgi:hypothetical protein